MPGIFRRGAGDGTRTRDSLLGRQELYQLSYSRKVGHKSSPPLTCYHTGFASASPANERHNWR
jgi:hypothetical protein